jgi:hypothetical protein
MYRRSKFLEILHEIREEMSLEADYDMDLFAEIVRSGQRPRHGKVRHIRGFRSFVPLDNFEMPDSEENRQD